MSCGLAPSVAESVELTVGEDESKGSHPLVGASICSDVQSAASLQEVEEALAVLVYTGLGVKLDV